jgi:aldose 1-epimerase
MRFRVIEEKFGNQLFIKLIDSETKEFVSILPENGGMLNSMELLFNNNSLISVLDDYKTENELTETLESSFKGSNLFPFPNRINSGKYSFSEKDYQLFVNFPHEDNAIHGLVFKSTFDITEKKESDSGAILILNYAPKEDLKGYPFKFKLSIEYSFGFQNGLKISTTIENLDNINMPVGHGWHPYLKLKSSVDELLFEFPSNKSYEVNEKMIPTGSTKIYKHYNTLTKIDSDSFDTCFALDNSNPIALIKLIDPELDGGISVWQETGVNKYNFLQIYTPEHRKTIAIEPMTCIPNAFNNKQGLITLKPGERINISCGISRI